MFSSNSNLPIVVLVALVITVGICYGHPSTGYQDIDHDQDQNLSTSGGSGASTDPLVRVRRQYYGGYGYGYGGGYTSRCCSYGYSYGPGCQYNGFWNARNNPTCYY